MKTWNGNVIATFSALVSILFSYLFHYFMSRMLSTGEYGELGVLSGLFAILLIPVTSVGVVLTREIAILEERGERDEVNYIMRRYFRKALILSSISSLFLFLASLLFSTGLSFTILSLVFFLSIPFNFGVMLISSFLQGKEDFAKASLLNASIPVLRVLSAVFLVWLGLGLLGAASSFLIPALFLLFPLLLLISNKVEKVHELGFRKSFLLVLGTSVLLSCMLYADLFAVRLLLGPVPAGVYNVANITSKVLYFVTVGLMMVFLPRSSKQFFTHQGKNVRSLLAGSLAILFPILTIFSLFYKQLITTFFPPSFSEAAIPFLILSFSAFFFSVFYILSNLMWARHHELPPLMISFSGFAMEIIALFLLIPRLGIIGAAYSSLLTSVFVLVLALFSSRKLLFPKPG